jgi:hypothetical protein
MRKAVGLRSRLFGAGSRGEINSNSASDMSLE